MLSSSGNDRVNDRTREVIGGGSADLLDATDEHTRTGGGGEHCLKGGYGRAVRNGDSNGLCPRLTTNSLADAKGGYSRPANSRGVGVMVILAKQSSRMGSVSNLAKPPKMRLRVLTSMSVMTLGASNSFAAISPGLPIQMMLSAMEVIQLDLCTVGTTDDQRVIAVGGLQEQWTACGVLHGCDSVIDGGLVGVDDGCAVALDGCESRADSSLSQSRNSELVGGLDAIDSVFQFGIDGQVHTMVDALDDMADNPVLESVNALEHQDSR